MLALVLERRWFGKRTWKDKDGQLIDDQLTEILRDIIESYELDRIQTEACELELQKQEEIRRAVAEERLRQAEEKHRFRDLLRLARYGQRASSISSFLQECETRFIDEGLQHDSPQAKFILWGYTKLMENEVECEAKLAKLIRTAI